VGDGPFESIESAHAFLHLLIEQVEDARASLKSDLDRTGDTSPARRADALRLADYKLHQLERHLVTGARILNDLRALRRLLLGERPAGRLRS
jgi:hypothetical protein